MSSAQRRYYDLQRRTKLVEQFCGTYGFELVRLNNGYQLRIEGVLDAYPVNGWWHWLPDGERGAWNTVENLREVMLCKLPTERKGDPTKGMPKEVVRPLSKSELGAVYEDARREVKVPSLPWPPPKWDVEAIRSLQASRRDTDDHMADALAYSALVLPNVRTMDESEYNKWYRRLWRWIRRAK